MAQRRLLNGSLGGSKKYFALNKRAGRKLVDFCQALFPLLMAKADAHGRLVADAFSVKQNVFPVSLHSEDDFDSALKALHDVGLILLYVVSGRRYLYVVHFRREQPGLSYIARSSCPEPPPDKVKRAESLTEFAETSRDSTYDVRRELEPEENKRSSHTPLPPKGPAAVSLFDRFWDAYPRKEAKDYARRCWEKLNPDSTLLETMLLWLQRAKASDQWQNPDKIPHASTWLNQRRWDGDPPPQTNAGGSGKPGEVSLAEQLGFGNSRSA